MTMMPKSVCRHPGADHMANLCLTCLGHTHAFLLRAASSLLEMSCKFKDRRLQCGAIDAVLENLPLLWLAPGCTQHPNERQIHA